MNGFEFILAFLKTPLGVCTSIVVLLIVVLLVRQFLIGNWTLSRTKDGHVIFTTAKQRGQYDVTHDLTKQVKRLTESLISKDEWHDLQERMKQLETNIKEVGIDLSKNIIYTTQYPYRERVLSAHRYVRLGGNGDVKKYISETLRPMHPEQFDGIWKTADELRGYVANPWRAE